MISEVALRIIDKMKALKGTRGPRINFTINIDILEGEPTYQGSVDDWTQDLIDENRLIDFENMIDAIYNVGVWS